MSASVIAYELLDRVAGESNFLWQYDYGQKMRLTGVELPMSYTVHFSNSSRGASIPSIGNASGVSIPDQVLLTGKPVYFWLFLHVGESDGQTAYANIINVHPRANLPEIDPPDPEQQSILDELMAALNAGILHVDEIAEGIPNVVDEEIAAAKERGEFKGDPGAVFTPSIVDGVMIWSNDGGLPNPEPTDFNRELGLDNLATKQELTGKVDNGKIGQPNGVAALDETGHVPSELLPSYVDDIVEYPSVSQFPSVGESGKIYISTSNNHWYRWTGSQYFDMTGADASLKADKRDTILETTLSRGRKENTNVGAASVAFGVNIEASGDYSQAFGYNTKASGGYAHAEGNGTKAQGNYSHAEGLGGTFTKNGNAYTSGAFGDRSHSEGNTTRADGTASHSEGTQTISSGNSSHAEGYMTEATAACAHAEGQLTKASGSYSHAEGIGGNFTKNSTYYTSGATGLYSHSEGNATVASGTASHTEGYNTIASDDYTHAEGNNTTASGANSHAEGNVTIASGYNSHSEGDNAKAIGISSHAEGGGTQAIGASSHAEGGGTTASGDYSHSEGGGTYATGNYSHAEGVGTTASGTMSHAEGSSTTASGNYSHSEGGGSTATGEAAHAEGAGTTASGSDSHAEGGGTQAIGAYSHTEGGGTRALGDYGHAEGSGSWADGSVSHAEGIQTKAYATGSHTEGLDTQATGRYSHVIGKYNVPDEFDNDRWPEWAQGEHCVPGDRRKRTRIVDEETVVEGFVCIVENTDADWDDTHWLNRHGIMNYAVIVGNGENQSYTSNAYCLDWDGNGHFAGDVYFGCNSDGSGGTKLENTVFATDNEVQAIISGYGVSA